MSDRVDTGDQTPMAGDDMGQLKKKKPLACKRCRQRRQKCTETRPCENCTQSGAECLPSESAAATKPALEQDYVDRLEERVAQLESLIPRESLDHYNDTFRQVTAGQSDAEPRPVSQTDLPRLQVTHPHQHSLLVDQAPRESSPLSTLGRGLFDIIIGGVGSDRAQHRDSDGSRREMDDVPLLEPDLEQFLLQVYFKMAQTQYPFMIKHEILQWAELRRQGAGAFYGEARWKAFFVYMVYCIALMMTKGRADGPSRSRDFYHLATTRYLPHVLETSDDLIRAQAYLLLTVYALHMTSREAIVALSSCSIRFCVAARLHLKEEEPKPVTPETLIQIQHRRRIFWCAYAIDRSICSVYDLPVSVADHHITVPYFDNIDDDQLHDVALWPSTRNSNQTARGVAPTSVLAALHVIAARQLESEIHDTLLSKDLTPESPAVAAWRERMFDKLKDWNAHSRRSTEPSQIGYTSLRWQRLIFVYGVIYLYRPTRSSACGPVGNVSVQACCQALLMFRKFQMVREIAQPWLGLLSQFQIGVTLLYCFFATPPSHWPPAYKSKDVPDAIRACSNTLAVLADRWIEAECVRDVFEVLAKEIPPGETWERPLRMQNDSRAAIEADWTALTNIVVDRPTLGMIREMIIDNFVDNAEVQNPLPNTGVRSAGGMAVADAGPLTDSSSHPVGDIGQRIAHSQTNSPPDPSVSNDDDGIAGGPFFQDGHADIFQDTDLQWSQPDNTSTMDLDTQYYLTSETDGFREESDMTLH